MENITLKFTGAIVLSIVIAFALSLLPLREEWGLLRPEWIALTLVHWALYAPKKASLLVAWIAGLFVDALHGSILGQHAFGFSMLMLMTLRLRSRILVDSLLHQFFVLFLVLGTYLLVNLWVLGFTGNSPAGWGYWFTVVTSLIVWPFYNYFLKIFHAKKKPFQ
ncbi:MAG: rod shape-determining protein MreD [Cocleimonas sp.]